MNVSIDGYKRNSNDVNNKYNFIPSGKITMQGVDKILTLIPVKNGKPDFQSKVIAKPGDDDFDFGDVDGVLEIPNSQYGDYLSGQAKLTSAIKPFQLGDYSGMNTSFNTPQTDFINSTGDINNIQTIYDPNTPTQLNTAPLYSKDEQYKMSMERMIQNQPTITEPQKQYDRSFTGAGNPYGGFNTDNSAVFLGQSIAKGNPLGIATGGLKVGLSIGRNIFSGMGAQKRFNQAVMEQEEQIRKDAEKRGQYYAQKGGVLLTGNAIVGNPNNPNPTAEVESGEHLQTPDGKVIEVMGKKHSEGGELITAPDGTKVISDYVKIGAPLAKVFKKEFGINVVAGSTFATVIDRYKKKIGLDKLLDEEVELIGKIANQEKVKNETVQDLNLEILSKKYQDLESRKQPMEDDLTKFTNYVFEKQESKKQTDDNKFKKQQGGEVNQSDQIQQALAQFAQQEGIPLDELISQLQQLPEDQLNEFLSKIMQPQMQKGGKLKNSTPSWVEKKAINLYTNLNSKKIEKESNRYLGDELTSLIKSGNSWNEDFIKSPKYREMLSKYIPENELDSEIEDRLNNIGKKGYVSIPNNIVGGHYNYIEYLPQHSNIAKGINLYDNNKGKIAINSDVITNPNLITYSDIIKNQSKQIIEGDKRIPNKTLASWINKYIDNSNLGTIDDANDDLKKDMPMWHKRLIPNERGIEYKGKELMTSPLSTPSELVGVTNAFREDIMSMGDYNPNYESATKENMNWLYNYKGGKDGKKPVQSLNELLDIVQPNWYEDGVKTESSDKIIDILNNVVINNKKTDDTLLYAQKGGEVVKTTDAEEGDLESLIMSYAEMKGIDPQELMQQLSQLSEEELEQAVKQIQIELEGSSSGGEMEQIVLAYAKKNNMNPEQLLQQLSELSEEELNEVLTQMKSEL